MGVETGTALGRLRDRGGGVHGRRLAGRPGQRRRRRRGLGPLPHHARGRRRRRGRAGGLPAHHTAPSRGSRREWSRRKWSCPRSSRIQPRWLRAGTAAGCQPRRAGGAHRGVEARCLRRRHPRLVRPRARRRRGAATHALRGDGGGAGHESAGEAQDAQESRGQCRPHNCRGRRCLCRRHLGWGCSCIVDRTSRTCKAFEGGGGGSGVGPERAEDDLRAQGESVHHPRGVGKRGDCHGPSMLPGCRPQHGARGQGRENRPALPEREGCGGEVEARNGDPLLYASRAHRLLV
mmetsp:Transcript_152063/g.488257  ORF Transcript_152063/g.488257 Transcript_152063/m.488257 type:complete len:291 (-) Transcript_152063:1064-1936(-)